MVLFLLRKWKQLPYNPSLCSFLLPLLSATGQCNIILNLLLKHPATNYCSRAGAAHQQVCSNPTVSDVEEIRARVKSAADFTQRQDSE